MVESLKKIHIVFQQCHQAFSYRSKHSLLNLNKVRGIFIVINGVTVNNKRSIDSLLLVIRDCYFLCTEQQFVRGHPGQQFIEKLRKTCSHHNQVAGMMGFSRKPDYRTWLGSIQRNKDSYNSPVKQCHKMPQNQVRESVIPYS